MSLLAGLIGCKTDPFTQTTDILEQNEKHNRRELEQSIERILQDQRGSKPLDPKNNRYRPDFKNSSPEIDNVWKCFHKKS